MIQYTFRNLISTGSVLGSKGQKVTADVRFSDGEGSDCQTSDNGLKNQEVC
jgi:hypothetical protein